MASSLATAPRCRATEGHIDFDGYVAEMKKIQAENVEGFKKSARPQLEQKGEWKPRRRPDFSPKASTTQSFDWAGSA